MEKISMPIYYVVSERSQSPLAYQFSIYNILKVIACDLSEVGYYYDKEVRPLQDVGRNVYGYIFAREPENPFREWKNEDGN